MSSAAAVADRRHAGGRSARRCGACPGEGGLAAEVGEKVLSDGEGGEEGGEVVEDVEERGVVGVDLLQ